MANLKKIIISGVVVVAALGGTAAVLLVPKKIDVNEVKPMDIVQTVKVTGNIEADEIETLYAPVSGRISEINIKAGEAVVQSDVIAAYDITLIENEYMKAAAALEANKQDYEAAVSENNNASSKYAKAQSSEQSNRSELEATMGMINALDITNRGDYLEPGDYNNSLDLEAQMKNVEQSTQINIADKTAAVTKLEEMKSLEASYLDAYTSAVSALVGAQTALDDAMDNHDYTLSDAEKHVLELAVETASVKYVTTKQEYEDLQVRIANAESEVQNATNRLNENRNQLSSALTQLDDIYKKNYSKTMSDEEYAQYVALQSRMQLLQQDLAKNISDRQYNESKLINEHTIEQYQYNVDISEVDVNSADYNLIRAKEGIRADKSGVILEKFVDSNAVVEAGTPICTVQPIDDIKVEVMISKFDIDKINLNQLADITVGEARYTGRVSKIFPVAEKDASGKPKVKVWVKMDVTENIPTIGLEAKVTIHTNEEKGALAVPYESVYSDDDGDYIYVLEGSQAVKKYIEIGIKGDSNYSIESGVSEGDEVIVAPFSDAKLNGRYMPSNQ